MDKVDAFLKKHHLTFNIIRGDKLAYFGARGESTVGQLGVYCLVTRSPLALVGAVSVDTKYFGTLLKSILKTKTNPFAKAPIMSNIAVALYFSTADVKLPKANPLPKPFQDITDLKAGFCLKGALKAPIVPCGKKGGMAGLCSKLKTLLGAKGQFALSACITATEIKFSFTVENLKLSKAATLDKAGFFFSLNPKSPQNFKLGAECQVTVPIHKSPVSFGGQLTFTFATMAIGFKLYMKGLLPKAFGVAVLNLHGIEFGAELSAAVGLAGLTLGGGLSLGSAKACTALFKTAKKNAAAGLLQKINDGPVKFGSKRALELGWMRTGWTTMEPARSWLRWMRSPTQRRMQLPSKPILDSTPPQLRFISMRPCPRQPSSSWFLQQVPASRCHQPLATLAFPATMEQNGPTSPLRHEMRRSRVLT